MAIVWKCDGCGAEGHIHPATEPQYTEELKEVDVPVPQTEKGGKVTFKIEKKKQPVKVPVMTTMRQQNIHTRQVSEVQVQVHKDLTPRAYIVRLSLGQEEIVRDFCKACLDKRMPVLRAAWDALEKLS